MQDLLKNYQLQIDDYDLLNKSIIWTKILNNSHKTIGSEKLRNFFSNNFSDGIDNSRLVGMNDIKKNFLKLCEKYQIDKILKLFPDENNNVGNSKNYYSYQNKIISYGDIFSVNFYFEIEKYFLNKKNIILEIGGGYGGLARIVSNNQNCTYVLIDLPETNLISSYYLKSHFPNSKFLLYEKYKINSNINIQDYDFVILPPWSLNKNISFDFCINIRSMMEMDVLSINKYFKYIQENLKNDGYFLNVNRYFSNDNNYNFYFNKFPYDKNWTVVKTDTSWIQKDIHLLLTRRTLNSLDEINKLMKKLEIFIKNRISYKANIYYKIKILLKNLFS